jgi:hypothetical protein
MLALCKCCDSFKQDVGNLCKISLLVTFSFISSNQRKVIRFTRVQKGSIILTIHWIKYGGNIFWKQKMCFTVLRVHRTSVGLLYVTDPHFIKDTRVTIVLTETESGILSRVCMSYIRSHNILYYVSTLLITVTEIVVVITDYGPRFHSD